MIIRNGRIQAAGCLLPLPEDRTLSTELVHAIARLSVCLNKQCVVVVVASEETGAISYTYGGHIYRHLPEDQIKEALRHLWKDLVKILRACGNGVARNDDSFETQLACKNTFIVGSHRHVVFIMRDQNPVMEVSYTVPVQVQNLAANYSRGCT